MVSPNIDSTLPHTTFNRSMVTQRIITNIADIRFLIQTKVTVLYSRLCQTFRLIISILSIRNKMPSMYILLIFFVRMQSFLYEPVLCSLIKILFYRSTNHISLATHFSIRRTILKISSIKQFLCFTTVTVCYHFSNLPRLKIIKVISIIRSIAMNYRILFIYIYNGITFR